MQRKPFRSPLLGAGLELHIEMIKRRLTYYGDLLLRPEQRRVSVSVTADETAVVVVVCAWKKKSSLWDLCVCVL